MPQPSTHPPADPRDPLDPLDALAEEYLSRCRRGEAATIEEYAAAYPDLADEIRELFPTIAALEALKETRSGSGRTADAAVAGMPAPARLGDFRLLREIGRGGMGVVYEAQQESLARRVAVKVLPAALLQDTIHIERFEREARTAARLHHTNIVPIFGVGEDNGCHYYVMQYIRGIGLDAVFRRLAREARHEVATGDETTPAESASRGSSSLRTRDVFATVRDLVTTHEPAEAPAQPPPAAPRRTSLAAHARAVARIGLQTADALAYAHAQGTMHRDIKPANLLLDADGAVWIADFGLAKAIDDAGVTRTGDVIGTLRYMAPEQFQGQAEPRSDVYALGVTLYELATLRPAFQANSRAALLSAIMKGDITPPPRGPGHLPRDLETILLKAMAATTIDRYDSAAALAEDLRRFLEDRPVLARRITLAERAVRWTRRNPAVATLLGSVALLLVAVASVSSAAYWNARAAQTQIAAALAGEQDQRGRVESIAQLSIHAIDRIFAELTPQRGGTLLSDTFDVGQDEQVTLPTEPVITPETAALLEQMLTFYEQLADQQGDLPGLRERIAAAHTRVGDIHQRLGDLEAATTAYEQAIEAYAALAPQEIDEATRALAIARLRSELGAMLLTEDHFRDGRLALRTAYDDLKSLVGGDSANRAARFALARVCYLLGQSPRASLPPPPPRGPGGPPGMGRPSPERAIGNMLRGLRNLRRGPEGVPDGPPPPENGGPPPLPPPPPDALPLAGGPIALGERVPYLREAIALLQSLLAESPTDAEARRLLALCYIAQADLPPRAATVERDEPPLEVGIRLLEALTQEYPTVADYRFDLAQAYARDALDPRAAEGRGAAPDFARARRAVTLLNELVAQHPTVAEYVVALARVQHEIGRREMRMGALGPAVKSFEDAVALQQSLVDRFPGSSVHSVGLVLFETALADACLRQNNRDAARNALDRAVTVVEALIGDDDDRRPGYVRSIAGHALMMRANLARLEGDVARAERLTAQARRLGPQRGRDRNDSEARPPRHGRPRDGLPGRPRRGAASQPAERPPHSP